jgi:hypothetical protein
VLGCVLRRDGHLGARPLGEDGEEAGHVFDDLPGVLAAQITPEARLPDFTRSVAMKAEKNAHALGARKAGTGWTAHHPARDVRAARIVAGGDRSAPPLWVGPRWNVRKGCAP